MHGPINVKFANNISKWQIEFNSEFKGLKIRKSKLPYTIRHAIPNAVVDLIVCATRNITRINWKTNRVLSI
jgi:hypothetical protein